MATEKRLIDANALKIAFKCREMADIDMYGGVHIAECFQGYEANAIVDEMPTVDAVEVVRCKDCKHMEATSIGYRWCKAWERIQTMGDEGYCCFGERRTDDGEK